MNIYGIIVTILLIMSCIANLVLFGVFFIFLSRRKRRRLGEVDYWVDADIISREQGERILSQKGGVHWKKRSVTEKISATRIPGILIGFATILLCVGISLFYAANWRGMPPLAKLIQIFILIVGLYGTAFFLLEIKKSSPLIGRLFLFLGMVSFGVGITLVAQIYHISSHPTNGVLVWALGVLITSIIMEEKWGLFLAALLFLIWDAWEIGVYLNPNYVSVIVPVILIILFYRSGSRVGVLLSILGALWLVVKINTHMVSDLSEQFQLMLVINWLFLPLGVILATVAYLIPFNKTLSWSIYLLKGLGWGSVLWSILAISIPVRVDVAFPIYAPEYTFFMSETLTLIVCAAVALYFLWKTGKECRLLVACALFSLLPFFTPFGNLPYLMAITHLGLLGLLFGILYTSQSKYADSRLEYYIAFSVAVIIMVVKGILFFTRGTDYSNREHLIASLLALLAFSTACFLTNLGVSLLLKREGKEYPTRLLSYIWGLTGLWVIYYLSFRINTHQQTILNAKPETLVVLSLFLALSLVLYVALWSKSDETLMIRLSGLVFGVTVIAMFISGPEISWVVYSLIFNALLLLVTVFLLYVSVHFNSVHITNAAIAMFVLHIITRYFDIFLELLSGSLLFIITGVMALIGGRFLEKKRRKLVSSMRHP